MVRPDTCEPRAVWLLVVQPRGGRAAACTLALAGPSSDVRAPRALSASGRSFQASGLTVARVAAVAAHQRAWRFTRGPVNSVPGEPADGGTTASGTQDQPVSWMPLSLSRAHDLNKIKYLLEERGREKPVLGASLRLSELGGRRVEIPAPEEGSDPAFA